MFFFWLDDFGSGSLTCFNNLWRASIPGWGINFGASPIPWVRNIEVQIPSYEILFGTLVE